MPADDSPAFSPTAVDVAFDAFSQQPPAWVLESFGPAGPDGTWGGLSLGDVIHDFGPVEEVDPEDEAPSEAYLRKWESTWSI